MYIERKIRKSSASCVPDMKSTVEIGSSSSVKSFNSQHSDNVTRLSATQTKTQLFLTNHCLQKHKFAFVKMFLLMEADLYYEYKLKKRIMSKYYETN